jgi:hypothetical protein
MFHKVKTENQGQPSMISNPPLASHSITFKPTYCYDAIDCKRYLHSKIEAAIEDKKMLQRKRRKAY